jgi:hypothetical protein
MGDLPANTADLCREMEALAVLLKQMSMHLDQLAQTTEPKCKISSTELDKSKYDYRFIAASARFCISFGDTSSLWVPIPQVLPK